MTLTKVFKLDTENDLDLSTGRIIILTDQESLAQRVQTRLNTFRGECFLDPGVGTPWLTQIFASGRPTASALNGAILTSLASVSGIREVRGLDYLFDKFTRKLEIQLRIISETKETTELTVEAAI